MDCIECNETITNPLCPACLRAGVKQWLLEQRQDDLAHEVDELTRNIFANNGVVFCIRCDSLMALCPYCYTSRVFDLIKEHPRLVDQYLTYFNFDLGHMGWEREAAGYIEE